MSDIAGQNPRNGLREKLKSSGDVQNASIEVLDELAETRIDELTQILVTLPSAKNLENKSVEVFKALELVTVFIRQKSNPDFVLSAMPMLLREGKLKILGIKTKKDLIKKLKEAVKGKEDLKTGIGDISAFINVISVDLPPEKIDKDLKGKKALAKVRKAVSQAHEDSFSKKSFDLIERSLGRKGANKAQYKKYKKLVLSEDLKGISNNEKFGSVQPEYAYDLLMQTCKANKMNIFEVLGVDSKILIKKIDSGESLTNEETTLVNLIRHVNIVLDYNMQKFTKKAERPTMNSYFVGNPDLFLKGKGGVDPKEKFTILAKKIDGKYFVAEEPIYTTLPPSFLNPTTAKSAVQGLNESSDLGVKLSMGTGVTVQEGNQIIVNSDIAILKSRISEVEGLLNKHPLTEKRKEVFTSALFAKKDGKYSLETTYSIKLRFIAAYLKHELGFNKPEDAKKRVDLVKMLAKADESIQDAVLQKIVDIRQMKKNQKLSKSQVRGKVMHVINNPLGGLDASVASLDQVPEKLSNLPGSSEVKNGSAQKVIDKVYGVIRNFDTTTEENRLRKHHTDKDDSYQVIQPSSDLLLFEKLKIYLIEKGGYTEYSAESNLNKISNEGGGKNALKHLKTALDELSIKDGSQPGALKNGANITNSKAIRNTIREKLQEISKNFGKGDLLPTPYRSENENSNSSVGPRSSC